jgi:hypothetical protein
MGSRAFARLKGCEQLIAAVGLSADRRLIAVVRYRRSAEAQEQMEHTAHSAVEAATDMPGAAAAQSTPDRAAG